MHTRPALVLHPADVLLAPPTRKRLLHFPALSIPPTTDHTAKCQGRKKSKQTRAHIHAGGRADSNSFSFTKTGTNERTDERTDEQSPKLERTLILVIERRLPARPVKLCIAVVFDRQFNQPHKA